MARYENDDDKGSVINCQWDWPVWCIVLMAFAGIFVIAGVVLTGLNGRNYTLMKKMYGHTNPPPSRRPVTAPTPAAAAKASKT